MDNKWLAFVIVISIIVVAVIITVLRIKRNMNITPKNKIWNTVLDIIMFATIITAVFSLFLGGYFSFIQCENGKTIRELKNQKIVRIKEDGDGIKVYYEKDDEIIPETLNLVNTVYTRKSDQIKYENNGWGYKLYIPAKYLKE